jgi:hypothetical protein
VEGVFSAMATAPGRQKLNGHLIIQELLRNMDLGQFEMSYSVLLPCVFSVYLNPEDYTRLSGIFDLIAQDAKRALASQVAKLNSSTKLFGIRRKTAREYRIAAKDWVIQFYADAEGVVPPGDIEIHSELSETAQPGFQGVKTTLMDREPSVTSVQQSAVAGADTRSKPTERVYGEIRYEDESGPQLYLIAQNVVRIGRGADDDPMDVALYANDDVSREHCVLRRDAATSQFYITDKSTNGTWLDRKRLKRGVEQAVPQRAEIGVAETVTLWFQVRS